MDEGDSGTDETEGPGEDAGTGSGVPTPESDDREEAAEAPGDADETEPEADDGSGHPAGEATPEEEEGEGEEEAAARGDEAGSSNLEDGAEAEDGELDEGSAESRVGGTAPGGTGERDEVEGEADVDADSNPDSEADSEEEREPADGESSDSRAASEVDAPADEIVFDPEAGPHEPEDEGAPPGPSDDAVEQTVEGGADAHAVDGGETPPGEAPEEVPVPGGATPPSPTSPEPGEEFGPGAPDDEEMPLAAHIEEMIKRLAVVIVIMAIVSAITFPFADRLINFLWYSFLPGIAESCPAPTELANSGDQACPRLYHPLSLMLARLKTASLLGLVIALPVFVYETYLFMRPGLYPNERRYYLAAVPTSLVLAGVGIAFAYFLVLPVIFTYFLGYSMHAVDTIAFSLSETFDLILLMMGLFAVVFQIPLFMMLAIMMGVTTRRWLVRRRIYFWGGFLGLAFLFSPDPTGMAPFIVAITMVVLFEGTLLLLRWTGR
jgi:sec-independent protein translocase protein TatC